MSRVRADKFLDRAATGAPVLVYGAELPVGYGITGAGGINVTGVGTFGKVSSSEVVSATTFSDTTDSTSSTSGAVIISGGVGIAKSLFVGNNVTIGGTITYEDVTNIDSVGIVTAQLGVIATAGRGVQITAGGLNVDAGIGTFDAGLSVAGRGIDITAGGLDVSAGISTFGGGDIQINGSAAGVSSVTWDASANSLIFKDNSKVTFGDNSDLVIYHDGAKSIINDDGTGDIVMQSGGTTRIETTSTGAVVTGICSATSFSGAINSFTLGADGTSHYTFTGIGLTVTTNDPTIYLARGQVYHFVNTMGAHPFRIQSTSNGSTGTIYNHGVTNNDVSNGTLIFEVPFNAPNTLYYQCTAHGNMGGSIVIHPSI